MEDELNEAKSLYMSNLASIEEALATDPDNAELRQVQNELRTALEATNSALQDILSSKQADDPDTAEAAAPNPHPPRVSNHNNNARIHPRSLYSTSEPDFASLAELHPSLKPYLIPPKHDKRQTTTTKANSTAATTKKRATFDFANPDACRELSKILLKSDFGVTWDLPKGHLVPPVTNRFNYILWIEDLLNLSSPVSSSHTSTSNNNVQMLIKGLDIGCGASCIYPLLGAASLGWHFVGVDVTSEAVEWAKKNVEMNQQLKDLIEIRKVEMQPEQKVFFSAINPTNKETATSTATASTNTFTNKGILASAFRDDDYENNKETFAFTMCNPPFFEKMEQASSNPNTAFGGTAAESVYPGGEEAFVRNMFEDSLVLKDRVHWFTTMVGKKVTLKALRKWLHAEPSVHVVRTTEFFQGQTSRWGLAWSFVVDPSVALKPIERGTIGDKRREEAQQEKVPLLPPQQQRKKRKIAGRSVSLHLALKDSHAALHLLNHIKTCLQNAWSLKCSLDVSQYQLTAEPESSLPSSLSNIAAAPLGAAASTSFTVQLLAQQPKRYVLTIGLAKNIHYQHSTTANTTDSWFSEIVEAIEAAVNSHSGAQIIS